jgi:hypothetical protein
LSSKMLKLAVNRAMLRHAAQAEEAAPPLARPASQRPGPASMCSAVVAETDVDLSALVTLQRFFRVRFFR